MRLFYALMFNVLAFACSEVCERDLSL